MPKIGTDVGLMTLHIHQEGGKGFITHRKRLLGGYPSRFGMAQVRRGNVLWFLSGLGVGLGSGFLHSLEFEWFELPCQWQWAFSLAAWLWGEKKVGSP